MYLFITYGVEGWRGVQQRGLEIARNFDKKDVLFWNGYDSDFIAREGFKCQTVDLSLIDPKKIKFPTNTKAAIFADLPTNELFNFSLFLAAKEQKIPVVVFDQIYRKGQLEEGVYKTMAEQADLLVLNGLNFLKEKETKKIKFIPPLASYASKKNIKGIVARKYGLDPGKIWIFVSGYYKSTWEMVKKAYPAFSKKNNFNLIISGLDVKRPKKDKEKLLLPFLQGSEYFDFLDAAEILVSKFGYLQILEALALGTIPVVAGEAGYVLQMEILDKELQETIGYANDHKDLAKILSGLLSGAKQRNRLSNKIALLHDGSFYGSKMAAGYIRNIKSAEKKKKATKKVLLVVNDEIGKAEEFIKNENNLYTVKFIASVSNPGPALYPVKRPDETLLGAPVKELIVKQQEILPHSFAEIYLLSPRKYDGLIDIIPWYNTWIDNLVSLLEESDRIFVGPRAKYLLANLLRPFKSKTKVLEFKK